jgi:hypothetical protein
MKTKKELKNQKAHTLELQSALHYLTRIHMGRLGLRATAAKWVLLKRNLIL